MNTKKVIKNLKEIKDKELREKACAYVEKLMEVDALAITLPFFADNIRRDEFVTGELTTWYSGMKFSWGVCRYLFTSKNKPTRFFGRFKEQYLFKIYINTLEIYDSHNKYGLEDLARLSYYYSSDNSTFYCNDEELIPLLDALAEWKDKALIQVAIEDKEDKEKEIRERN